ncbi:hypothetical protein KFE25_012859 [Diacronema lutheri]|uniref:Cyclic nucleotide-binding domain-containing protein n=1 Tax=Diacronema lutheri TaxID=2081491 RepID=A0A8J5X905_DIALT|nr:hypothetical protein KFE25_012859 [Diacronema lutheri]
MLDRLGQPPSGLLGPPLALARASLERGAQARQSLLTSAEGVARADSGCDRVAASASAAALLPPPAAPGAVVLPNGQLISRERLRRNGHSIEDRVANSLARGRPLAPKPATARSPSPPRQHAQARAQGRGDPPSPALSPPSPPKPQACVAKPSLQPLRPMGPPAPPVAPVAHAPHASRALIALVRRSVSALALHASHAAALANGAQHPAVTDGIGWAGGEALPPFSAREQTPASASARAGSLAPSEHAGSGGSGGGRDARGRGERGARAPTRRGDGRAAVFLPSSLPVLVLSAEPTHRAHRQDAIFFPPLPVLTMPTQPPRDGAGPDGAGPDGAGPDGAGAGDAWAASRLPHGAAAREAVGGVTAMAEEAHKAIAYGRNGAALAHAASTGIAIATEVKPLPHATAAPEAPSGVQQLSAADWLSLPATGAGAARADGSSRVVPVASGATFAPLPCGSPLRASRAATGGLAAGGKRSTLAAPATPAGALRERARARGAVGGGSNYERAPPAAGGGRFVGRVRRHGGFVNGWQRIFASAPFQQLLRAARATRAAARTDARALASAIVLSAEVRAAMLGAQPPFARLPLHALLAVAEATRLALHVRYAVVTRHAHYARDFGVVVVGALAAHRAAGDADGGKPSGDGGGGGGADGGARILRPGDSYGEEALLLPQSGASSDHPQLTRLAISALQPTLVLTLSADAARAARWAWWPRVEEVVLLGDPAVADRARLLALTLSLRHADPLALARAAALCEWVPARPGQQLFAQGQVAAAMLILCTGAIHRYATPGASGANEPHAASAAVAAVVAADDGEGGDGSGGWHGSPPLPVRLAAVDCAPPAPPSGVAAPRARAPAHAAPSASPPAQPPPQPPPPAARSQLLGVSAALARARHAYSAAADVPSQLLAVPALQINAFASALHIPLSELADVAAAEAAADAATLRDAARAARRRRGVSLLAHGLLAGSRNEADAPSPPPHRPARGTGGGGDGGGIGVGGDSDGGGGGARVPHAPPRALISRIASAAAAALGGGGGMDAALDAALAAVAASPQPSPPQPRARNKPRARAGGGEHRAGDGGEGGGDGDKSHAGASAGADGARPDEQRAAPRAVARRRERLRRREHVVAVAAAHAGALSSVVSAAGTPVGAGAGAAGSGRQLPGYMRARVGPEGDGARRWREEEWRAAQFARRLAAAGGKGRGAHAPVEAHATDLLAHEHERSESSSSEA